MDELARCVMDKINHWKTIVFGKAIYHVTTKSANKQSGIIDGSAHTDMFESLLEGVHRKTGPTANASEVIDVDPQEQLLSNTELPLVES